MVKNETGHRKSVIVTGASTGLGLEITLYLAEQGFNVYATMRDLSRRNLIDTKAMQRGLKIEVLQLDITDRNSISTALETIIEQTGEIFALINNAGIGLRGYFEDLSEEEIHKVFDVNLFGTMAVTRAVLPYMRSAGKGRILIITSVGGLIGSLGVSAYCSTKFAQEGFGESLSQELSPLGIHVSLIEPAIIKTERWGINRGNAKGAHDSGSLYSEWFRKSEILADKLVESSPTTPEHVAVKVYDALTARRPSLRYMVGYRAGLVVLLRRYLPHKLFDRLYFGEAVRRVTGYRKAFR
ncbi:SDR family oxidoreductase [Desulfobacula sp.]|uniref:SDR family oxidoreductase n=1 Tax=Desulfobacula sp. TaxID=2593537 RepID=UPI00261AAF64|nr:SDR family oxidoreductase [Desulfobacula sp.]